MPCLKSESKVKMSLPLERMIWTLRILSKEIRFMAIARTRRFFSRGGAGQDQKSTGRGRTPEAEKPG